MSAWCSWARFTSTRNAYFIGNSYTSSCPSCISFNTIHICNHDVFLPDCLICFLHLNNDHVFVLLLCYNHPIHFLEYFLVIFWISTFSLFLWLFYGPCYDGHTYTIKLDLFHVKKLHRGLDRKIICRNPAKYKNLSFVEFYLLFRVQSLSFCLGNLGFYFVFLNVIFWKRRNMLSSSRLEERILLPIHPKVCSLSQNSN